MTVSCLFRVSTAANHYLGLRSDSTTVAETQIFDATVTTGAVTRIYCVSGLTPNTSYTLKLAGYSSAGSLTAYTGASYGGLLMEVRE